MGWVEGRWEGGGMKVACILIGRTTSNCLRKLEVAADDVMCKNLSSRIKRSQARYMGK